MVAPSVLPGRAFKRVDRVSRLLFHWTARDLSLAARTGQVPTFNRASPGVAIDRDGFVRSAVHSQPRWEMVDLDGDGIRETPGLVLEGSRINKQPASEDLNNATYWLKANGLTVTPAALTIGDVVLDLLDDASAAAIRYLQSNTNIVFTATTGAMLIHTKHGTATKSDFEIFNNTTGLSRSQVRINWNADGTIASYTPTAATVLRTIPLVSGAYLILVQCTGLTIGDNYIVRLFPCGDGLASDVGSCYFGGVQVEDAAFPSSYTKTTSGTAPRSAESLTYPFGFDPYLDLTVFARIARPVHADVVGSLGLDPGIARIATSVPSPLFTFTQATRQFGINLDTAGADAIQVQALPSGAELRVAYQLRNLATTGGLVRIDGGAGFTADAGPASAVAAYGNQTLLVGSWLAGQELFGVLLELKIAAGLYTRDQMLQLT